MDIMNSSDGLDGSPSTELTERTTQAQVSLDAEVEQINSGNEWMAYLGGGPAKTPYLKSEGRLKKKPKTILVSAKQRRIYSECK